MLLTFLFKNSIPIILGVRHVSISLLDGESLNIFVNCLASIEYGIMSVLLCIICQTN